MSHLYSAATPLLGLLTVALLAFLPERNGAAQETVGAEIRVGAWNAG